MSSEEDEPFVQLKVAAKPLPPPVIHAPLPPEDKQTKPAEEKENKTGSNNDQKVKHLFFF